MELSRETWLRGAIEELRPVFAAEGITVPEAIRVSCGWPSRGALARRKRTIGECWHADHGAKGAAEVFISPLLADQTEVLATLAHELAHASLGYGIGHKAPFARLVKAIGLEGKPTATYAGEKFKLWVSSAIERLGPYPHEAMSAVSRQKKQATRLRKYVCGHGQIIRAATDTLNAHCEECSTKFTLQDGSNETE